MLFRTELLLPTSSFLISHRDGIVLIGSCFAENIGALFSRYRFQVTANPHGILFNPLSIADALDDVMEKRNYTVADLLKMENKYVSLSHHGKYSGENADTVIQGINAAISEAHESLKVSSTLIVTLGSTWAWRHKETGRVVANCHKIPQQQFDKVLIASHEIQQRFTLLLSKLNVFNPQLRIIFTLSPVRYLRDGLVQNSLSKAHLLTAIHALCDSFAHCHYFPAYELVMDDLRDYRFFKEDMLHPNDQAILYVWEKFVGWCLSGETKSMLTQLEKHLLLLEHRPIGEPDEEFERRRRAAEEAICALLK